MTQQELATAAGVSVSALKKYESGRQETPTTKAKKVAAALGLSVDDIATELPDGSASADRFRLAVLQDVMALGGVATADQLKQLQAFIEAQRGGGIAENEAQEDRQPTAFEKLVAAIDKNGFKAPSISKLVTNARSELLEEDDGALDALAGEHAVELKDGMEHEQAVDLVLSVALYSEDLLQREGGELDAIVDWINERVEVPSGFLGTCEYAVEKKGILENRETYNASLYFTVPKCLVDSAINRQFLPESILKTDI